MHAQRLRWVVPVVLLLFVVAFVGGQYVFRVGAADGCAHGSDGARYQWDHLEWRWAPIPGQWCVWTDTATGDHPSAWAFGPLPERRLGR